MTSVDPNFCKQATPPLLVREVSLSHIAIIAMKKPEMVFTSLVHRIDLAMLKKRTGESRSVEQQVWTR